MAANDSTIPRFLDVSKLNPPVKFTCDVHGERKIVMQFAPPSGSQGNQIPDPARLRCVDCLEEVIPSRIRSVE
jgi:hypothetical protein